MSAKLFDALRVHLEGDQFTRRIEPQSISDLPAGEVLVRVDWSALNYKDALSASGHPGVTREFPHTPGIDAAGEVVASESEDWKPGDPVLVTSYDLGMETEGGFGGYIRVPAEWVVRRPGDLSARQAMVLGTAGFTAAQCIRELRGRNVMPDKDGTTEVLVTGATGGVGSMAVAILAKLGYRVVAVSGKADAVEWLEGLGAAEVLPREALTDGNAKRPVVKARWAGVVDTVGGEPLAAAIKGVREWGTVTCCGLVASPELHTTVFPFILRHIALIGVSSQNCPIEPRREIWNDLVGPWRPVGLDDMAEEVDLQGLNDAIDRILAGGVRGRVVVRHEHRG